MSDSLIDSLARQAGTQGVPTPTPDTACHPILKMTSRINTPCPPYEGGLRLHVLGSGSKGNCSVLEWNGRCILIDAGLSHRATQTRMLACGLSIDDVVGILITHEHSDHIKGLSILHKHHALPIWSTQGSACKNPHVRQAASDTLTAYRSFTIGDLSVTPFATSHDAAESVGFRFEFDGDAVAYITDSGELDDFNRELIADARILAIESNHDLRMLAQCDYPTFLKQRIGSSAGHLSNKQAHGELVGGLITQRTQTVVGMHLSEQSNTPSIAWNTLRIACDHSHHPIDVFVASQHHPTSYW